MLQVLCRHGSALHCSESDIEALQPKPGSPAWLVEEVDAVRRGLMDLLHNVVLLRCPDSDKEFTPVRPPPLKPTRQCRLQCNSAAADKRAA